MRVAPCRQAPGTAREKQRRNEVSCLSAPYRNRFMSRAESVQIRINGFERQGKLRRLAGVTEAGACCRNPERSEGPLHGRKTERLWWTWSGSNRRPLPCHGSALPAAPQAHSEGTVLFSPTGMKSSNQRYSGASKQIKD